MNLDPYGVGLRVCKFRVQTLGCLSIRTSITSLSGRGGSAVEGSKHHPVCCLEPAMHSPSDESSGYYDKHPILGPFKYGGLLTGPKLLP